MRILKLKLHNFGVYAGDNIFEFHGRRPIVLIGGMNGRGKTTFLEAVLLALYGSNSIAFLESKRRSYSQYLRSFVNRNALNQTCSVELEFEVNNGEKENYLISRSWNAFTKKTIETIDVKKDGIHNDFLTKNWPMFVENLLPSALSTFFFFDGEKIAEMALDSTNAQLKNAIRSMMGIKILDVLKNDLTRNIKTISKKDLVDKTSEEVQRLRDLKDDANGELSNIDNEIKAVQEQIEKDSTTLDSMHQLYNAKGGDAINRRQEIVHEIESIKSNITAEENRLYDMSLKELPLVLVADLLKNIKLRATDEHLELVMRQAVMHMDELLTDFKQQYKADGSASEAFVEYVKKSTNSKDKKLIYKLSDQALFQITDLIEGRLENARKEAADIITNEDKLKKQLDDRESYLSLDINKKEIQDIYNSIKETEQKLISDQVKITNLEQKRTSANAKLIKATSDFNKYVESYLETAEVHDKLDRTIKYSNMALKILDKYQIELQKQKTDVLSNTITECYKKLANKKNLIEKIVMDPDTLDISYMSNDGTKVSQDSLSAGEQQLMVVSILWALTICSKKKLPVIIDAPLSRLDSYHRTALIETYFPNAGEQTIILSTDSEINRPYYELMKDNVGDEFTLQYSEETRSTSIKKGYLIGA